MVRKKNDRAIGDHFGSDSHKRNPGELSRSYRTLDSRELEVLIRNGNNADDWTKVLVSERFIPEQVINCRFHGLVRIGEMEEGFLEYHDLQLPIGLRDCTIISSDIGDNAALQSVGYLAFYIIDREVILLNIEEMVTTDHAKFGNGMVMEGEDPAVRVEIELGNENGGRKVIPFDGMLAGDAFLWSRFRENQPLMEALGAMTDASFDRRRGTWGHVGSGSVIKSCRIIKDITVGEGAYIKGANKLKNLTVNSSEEFPSQIGEGVELVNGIIGRGCRIFYGVKAVRFFLADHSNLKYGARLINSYLGENSTISCCEVLNALIFPGHEQHHNNSFLCAATLSGQSNIAAGATIGSNHNSRGPDGEIFAGRGFWPALSTSLKHNSHFASYTLLAKGAYPAELNIPLPFTLVSNSESKGRIEMMPGYWFRYNMYALARNAWKYGARDKRKDPVQLLEFDYLAPDTVGEMISALNLLEAWAGIAYDSTLLSSDEMMKTLLSYTFSFHKGWDCPEAMRPLVEAGRQWIIEAPEEADKTEIHAFGIEKGKRDTIIIRVASACAVYREMILLYGIKNIVEHCSPLGTSRGDSCRSAIISLAGQAADETWHNLGGQLICESDLKKLQKDIIDGTLPTWRDVHERYRELGQRYPEQKAAHALNALLRVSGRSIDNLLSGGALEELLDRSVTVQRSIAVNTRSSREKDYTSDFRKITYSSEDQMVAVVGTLSENDFISRIEEESRLFEAAVEDFRKAYRAC
jgi:hypothetical protein